jgi:hypothetical protein
MTRSYRKVPIFRLCGRGGSEKWYKRYRSSRERRAVKDALRVGDFLLLHFQQVRWDEWETGRDGKTLWLAAKGDKKKMSK